jgi:zinc protease
MKNIRLSRLHPILLTSLLLSPVLSGPGPAANAQTTKAQAAPSLTAQPSLLNGIRETKLANGLTVLTKEVHTAPVVYFRLV